MVQITYGEHCGTSHVVSVKAGLPLMEAAMQSDVPGIVAECGGACACGTCPIYIERAWQDRTPVRSEMEAAMLEYALETRESSRLACQIPVSDAMDGLIVGIPERQG